MVVVDLVFSKSFQQLWKELRKLNWTAKKPSSLGTHFRYVPPGRSVRGEEGRDYFEGEASLMAFAKRRRLLRLDVRVTAALVEAALQAPGATMAVAEANALRSVNESTTTNTIPALPSPAQPADNLAIDAEPSPEPTPKRRKKTTLTLIERDEARPRQDSTAASVGTAQSPTAYAFDTAEATAYSADTAQSTAEPTAEAVDTAQSTAEPTAEAVDTAQDTAQAVNTARGTPQATEAPDAAQIPDTPRRNANTEHCEPTILESVVAIIDKHIAKWRSREAQHEHVPSRAEVTCMHTELLRATTANAPVPPVVPVNTTAAPHTLQQITACYRNKKRQYLCKVCSALSNKERRSTESSWFCADCTRTFGGRVPLCVKIQPGQTLTCSQIWHDTWSNGTQIPPELRKNIRFSKPKRSEKE